MMRQKSIRRQKFKRKSWKVGKEGQVGKIEKVGKVGKVWFK